MKKICHRVTEAQRMFNIYTIIPSESLCLRGSFFDSLREEKNLC